MPSLDVLDSTMYYEESGTGTPVVFLHGNPTSSYLWRNVIPHVDEEARCLAPDLIGMGASGKPDIEYSFADHAAYLDAWIDRLGLDEIILVGHDWGGALAFDWAARHPDRVPGIVFMETIIKPMTAGELSPPARARTEAFRTPGTGEQLVLEQNIFIETAFKGGVLSPLSAEEVAPYRAPYPTPESRRPMLAWARMMPVDGEPADVIARINAYDTWLAESHSVVKLLLTFDSSPTLLIGPELAAWCKENIAELEVEHCGASGHHAPEDQPGAIGETIARWLDIYGLTEL